MTGMRISGTCILIVISCLTLASCGNASPEPTSTPTLAVPTPTLEPMAAFVNGEGISMVHYQAELDRYVIAITETGLSAPGGAEPKTLILDELIDESLLAQAAYQSGFEINEADLDARLAQLADQIGGSQSLQDWQSRYGYSGTGLRQALQRSIAAAWMRDSILADVPLQAEQVHARQILLADEQTALVIKAQLDAGSDFSQLAYQFDNVTGGDLGWFPRGLLNFTEVETAAFALETGQYSDPVASAIGWHIILVVEKDQAHVLSPDGLFAVQNQALTSWIAQRRAESTIEILL
jgi:peptidyl-prolyl cis-trans isomerase C